MPSRNWVEKIGAPFSFLASCRMSTTRMIGMRAWSARMGISSSVYFFWRAL